MAYPIIKKERKRQGFTQKELADKSYVSFSTIRRIENEDNYTPSVLCLLSVCRALDLDYGEVVEQTVLTEEERTTDPGFKDFANDYAFMETYNSLNDDGKEKVKEYMYDLAENPKYKRADNE